MDMDFREYADSMQKVKHVRALFPLTGDRGRKAMVMM